MAAGGPGHTSACGRSGRNEMSPKNEPAGACAPAGFCPPCALRSASLSAVYFAPISGRALGGGDSGAAGGTGAAGSNAAGGGSGFALRPSMVDGGGGGSTAPPGVLLMRILPALPSRSSRASGDTGGRPQLVEPVAGSSVDFGVGFLLSIGTNWLASPIGAGFAVVSAGHKRLMSLSCDPVCRTFGSVIGSDPRAFGSTVVPAGCSPEPIGCAVPPVQLPVAPVFVPLAPTPAVMA